MSSAVISFDRRFLSWADKYDGHIMSEWMAEHVEIPVIVSAAYLLLVLYIPQAYMKNRESMRLRNLNIMWNLLLTTFSMAGAYHTLPRLYDMVFTKQFHIPLHNNEFQISYGSIYNCVCKWDPLMFYRGRVGAFVLLFIWSKIPEMFDTVLLVLQKKPVIFLHWFHHLTVMLYCWHAYANRISSGLIFAGMNYGVHSIMYLYYFICSLGYRRFVRPFASFITFLQIAQMVVGLFTEVFSLYYIYFDAKTGCDANATNVRLGFIMYLSYFFLFCKLFSDNYLSDTKTIKMRNTENDAIDSSASTKKLNGMIKKAA